MSELGLGTLQAGDRSFFRDSDPNEYRKVLRSALQKGFRHFDTAYSYREAEPLLGAVVREAGIDRESVSITDKIMPVPSLERKAEASLKRLGLEYIDTLLLHWPTGDETLLYNSLKCLEKLQERELVKRFGVSNFPHDLLDRLSSDFEIRAFERPVSLLWTKGLFKDIGLCRNRGISVLGYSPLGMGILLGRRAFPDDRSTLEILDRKELGTLIEEIEKIASERKTTRANICLSWALSTGADIVFTGASKVDQLAAIDDIIDLSAEEKLRLEKCSDALSSAFDYDNFYAHRWREQ